MSKTAPANTPMPVLFFPQMYLYELWKMLFLAWLGPARKEMPTGKTINEIRIGDTATFTKTISARDVELFADVTGDNQPVHLDESFAQETRFGSRIAHGLLTAGLISAALGKKLPGPGTIYCSQDLTFLKPVFLGEKITAEVVVSQIDRERGRVVFTATCFNEEHQKVLVGKATVIPPSK